MFVWAVAHSSEIADDPAYHASYWRRVEGSDVAPWLVGMMSAFFLGVLVGFFAARLGVL